MSQDRSTTVEEIVGQIKMKDGTTRYFRVGNDFGWSQWGESRGNLANSVPVIDAMVEGLKEAEISFDSDSDEDDEDEQDAYEVEQDDPDATYKIVRYYQSDEHEKQTIKRGLTLAEAKAHTNNPETSSTGTGARARKTTETYGEWFDGYTREGR